MGLIGLVFGLPLAPFRGLIRLGELIQEQVDREMADPTLIRRKLEEIENARAAGLISEEEERRTTERVLQRMSGRPVATPAVAPEAGGERR
jgi:hypothetical protein